jgi:hypothetical protein
VTRSAADRVADVRLLLAGAEQVFRERARFVPDLVRTTGLSPEGVDLGFASLERGATDRELLALVAAAGDAASVHVILSANVFVAPLRALALARAAAAHVTVRPSPRDPTLTRALVAAAGDGAISIVDARDPAESASEIHVYGRDATIAEVRARARPGAIVRGHGAGMGIAVVTKDADVRAAAEALACDVVAFDQRGCLSPRIVLVEGDDARGEAFALALHERLAAWGERVPRGLLADQERADATRWREALEFAGHVWSGADHLVALALAGSPLTVAPPGRHVLVAAERRVAGVAARIAPLGPFIVAVGTDDEPTVRPLVPSHARVGPLGSMQRPPLDGPVDRRVGRSV